MDRADEYLKDATQQTLFDRIGRLAKGLREPTLGWHCLVSGKGEHFFVSVSDSNKRELWLHAGSQDEIVNAFEAWVAARR